MKKKKIKKKEKNKKLKILWKEKAKNPNHR